MSIADNYLGGLVDQHQDLPLLEIRAALPADKYGLGDIFRNKISKNRDRFFLDLLPNNSQNWDCYLGAYMTQEILSRKGIESKIVTGRDYLKVFRTHFWIELGDGRTIDPTPIYNLVEADPAKKHLRNEEIRFKQLVKPRIPLDSLLPLRIAFIDDKFLLSYLGISRVIIPNNVGIEFGVKSKALPEAGAVKSSLFSQYLLVNTKTLVRGAEKLSEMIYRSTEQFDLCDGHDYLLDRDLIETFIRNVAKADKLNFIS